MKLVVIGSFKQIQDAENAKNIIDEITAYVSDSPDASSYRDITRYPDQLMTILQNLNFHDLKPSELEQFYDLHKIDLEDEKIVIKTDESDVSALLKIMLYKGAKIEMYSAHDHHNKES